MRWAASALLAVAAASLLGWYALAGAPGLTLAQNAEDTSWARQGRVLSKPSDAVVLAGSAVRGAARLRFVCDEQDQVAGRVVFPMEPWSDAPLRMQVDGGAWMALAGDVIEPGAAVQAVADGKSMAVMAAGRPTLVWTLEDVNCGLRWLQGQCGLPELEPAPASEPASSR